MEQLAAMSELPMEFHLQALIETLELGDRMDDIMTTMTDLYVSGDIGMTMPMLKSIDPKKASENDRGYAAFEQRIITDRNHVMAERSAPELAKGNVFMAVGALHLPGEEGVIEPACAGLYPHTGRLIHSSPALTGRTWRKTAA